MCCASPASLLAVLPALLGLRRAQLWSHRNVECLQATCLVCWPLSHSQYPEASCGTSWSQSRSLCASRGPFGLHPPVWRHIAQPTTDVGLFPAAEGSLANCDSCETKEAWSAEERVAGWLVSQVIPNHPKSPSAPRAATERFRGISRQGCELSPHAAMTQV